uniref:Uncharacterized protein n=1 Tax=Oryza punctata TaxID=4537 RepID=A0A0E0JV10_ORYPU
MAVAQMSRTAVVALFLVAVVVAAAYVPAPATAFGCFDDCYERCANGKKDDACNSMCKQACSGAGGGSAASPDNA